MFSIRTWGIWKMIRTIFRFSQNWYPILSIDVKSPMVLMAINLGLPDVFFDKAKWLSGLVRHFRFEFCVWWLFWWWTPTWCWLDLHLMVAGSIRIFYWFDRSHWSLITLISNHRRKFRSETSDNMDSWKAEVRRVRRDKIRRKKMQMREKIGKSRFTVFFQWFVAPEGLKVGSLKRRVRSQLARWDMKKCTPLWREAHFQVKMDKTLEERTTFGSWDVEKVHAVVARSTFWSQNVQNTPWSDHFWKLRCRKSARRCGAKHISKWKCTKHTILGALLEVEMSKKCTPLWREAHFEVKSVKNWRSRTTFGGSDVEKVSKKCTPLWREAHFEVKRVKNWGFWAFFDVKMSKK